MRSRILCAACLLTVIALFSGWVFGVTKPVSWDEKRQNGFIHEGRIMSVTKSQGSADGCGGVADGNILLQFDDGVVELDSYREIAGAIPLGRKVKLYQHGEGYHKAYYYFVEPSDTLGGTRNDASTD